jgi:secreted trypsin-like serine protease
VGGTKSTIKQFPFTVSIKANNGSASSASFCGGSIIAQNYILTAAHCTRGFNNFEIGIGSTLVQKAFMSLIIYSEAIEHPDFNPKNLNNDIALIKIPDLPMNAPNILPVRLPKRSQYNQTFIAVPAIVSGFGRTSDSSNNISPYMQHVQLKIIPNKECQKMYGSKVVNDNVMCAKGKDKKYAACLGGNIVPFFKLRKN